MKIKKTWRRPIMAILCLAAVFMFSGGVSAADETPNQDLLTMLEGAATDTGDAVKVSALPELDSYTGNILYRDYILELPYGSAATEITLPDSDKLTEDHTIICYPSDADDYQISLSSEDNRFHLPVTDMLMTRLSSEPSYLLFMTLPYHVYIAYTLPVSDFAITPSSAYAAQKQWINIGGVFDLENELFSDDIAISVYLSTEENGDVADAIGEPLITTKAEILADAGVEDGVIDVMQYKKGVGLMAENLSAGTYYVNMKIGEESNAAYVSHPYTVYATAKEYAKAAMDRLIGYYIDEPELEGNELDSFPAQMPFPIRMQLQNLKNAGYTFYDAKSGNDNSFYERFQPSGQFAVYMEPYYTGLSYYRDTGTDWEAWIFTALGDDYLYQPSSGSSQLLDFSGDGALLSGKSLLTTQNISTWIASDEDQTWMDTYGQELEKFGVTSDYDLTQYFISSTSPYNKEAFRRTAALIAMDADPRNPFPGESYNANHVDALMYTFYVQDTVTWDENGKADYSQAELRLDENGRLPFWNMDPLNLSYCMLALEMANASPEEGYTTEMQQAFVKSFLPLIEEQLAGFLEGAETGDGDPDAGGGYADAFAVDTCAMLSLPLCYAADDLVYGERINKIFEVMPTAFGAVVDSMGGTDDYYGTNSNSVAMAVNALVSAGYDAADLEGTEFQGTYQTLLSSLVNCQLDDGSISYGEGKGNRMATYQTLGALVDLYNGESCFTLHREDYLYHYPQYTDEGHLFAALMDGLPTSADELLWTDLANVTAARSGYTGFFNSLSKTQQETLSLYFDSQLTTLADLENSAGAALAAGMASLPAKDQVKISDQPLITAMRAAYDMLPESQKTIANGESNENLDRLRDAELAIRQWEVKEVADFILSLPSASDVTELDRGDIEAARAAYDGLSEDKKALIDGETLKVLRDAERALVLLASKNVASSIENLPEPKDVRITDEGAIETVRAAYDDLTEEQKSVVTNYSKLQRVEAVLMVLQEAVAQAVSDKITALPAAADVTVDDKEAIEDARAAYDQLTATQKSFVSAETLAKLTAAEEALVTAGEITIDDMADMQDSSAWYYGAAAKCIEEGLFKGDANRRFNPMNSITRAEFAQVLYNYYQDNTNVMKDGNAKTFKDVKSGAWYYNAVMACAKAGLIFGDEEGNFRPNQTILRQDVALIMMRISMGNEALNNLDVESLLADLAKQNLVFSDFYDTSVYAQKAMAAAAGVIFFGSDGKLHPKSNITRAEMAQVMYNYLFK